MKFYNNPKILWLIIVGLIVVIIVLLLLSKSKVESLTTLATASKGTIAELRGTLENAAVTITGLNQTLDKFKKRDSVMTWQVALVNLRLKQALLRPQSQTVIHDTTILLQHYDDLQVAYTDTTYQREGIAHYGDSSKPFMWNEHLQIRSYFTCDKFEGNEIYNMPVEINVPVIKTTVTEHVSWWYYAAPIVAGAAGYIYGTTKK